MRILGIDYGSKRVGVAISDEEGKFALPHSTLANSIKLSTQLVADIDRMAIDLGIKEIVIGESRAYDMTPNQILADTLVFKTRLEKKGYIVHLEPEFMTSVQAERFQGKNDKSDASAAALILQSYLDKVQSGS